MRSVLARATKTLARSGLILAMLPVRAAAMPQVESTIGRGASAPGAAEQATAQAARTALPVLLGSR